MPGAHRTQALGAVIRARREQRGLSREVLAVDAGLTTGTLARLELGQSDPGWSTICTILDSLEMSLRDLADAIELWERKQ
jgi:transcriptional regulator with XRE-family HTH domain